MLEGLDAIDWASLGHAYGEAANVPGLLWGLASGDRDERENALDGLFGTIYHQGTIYDATAPAVPFLLELAGHPRVRDRHRILNLLAAIAGGCGYCQVHQTLESPSRRANAEYQEALTEERTVQRAVRDAVWRGWPLFLRLLRDDDKALRRQALALARRLLEQPRAELAAALRHLLACLKEPAHAATAALLVRLGEAVRFHAAPGEALRAAKDHQERDIELSNMDDVREDKSAGDLPAWLELSEQDRLHGQTALAAVWQGWPIVCERAGSEEAAVRRGALILQAMLLRYAAATAPAGLADQATRTLVPAWVERLRATADKREQVCLIFALAAVAPSEAAVADAIEHTLQTTRSRLVGYVAALKMVDLRGDADDRGLDLLLRVHLGQRDVYQRLRKLPRWERYWATDRLTRLGPRVVERRLPLFVERVRSAGGGPGSSGQVREILKLAFGGKKLPAHATALDLTEAQRELLLAAADNGHFWSRLHNNRLVLDRLLGLPDDRRDLRRFLARPGEPLSQPRNDPEDALVQFERLVRDRLPFEIGGNPYERGEEDTRAPFRLIQENIEEMRRVSENYRPKDRPHIQTLAPCGHACDALVALLPLCPNLRDLDLAYGEATDASMHHLARLPHLEKLHLHDNWIGDAALEHLAGLTGLRELSLGRTEVTDDGLRHLTNLVRLRKLHLGQTRIRGAGLAHLRGAQELEELWFGGDHVTDEAIPPLGAFAGLEDLSVGGPHFTGRGLEAWKSLGSLKSLFLSGPLAAAGLARLPPLPGLENLSLRGKEVGDEVARAIPPLAGLKFLDFFQTGITDAALEGITRFPSLERLDLSWTRVTDAILAHLLRLTQVKWIGVYRTGVSPEGVQKLRRAFPEAHFSE